MPPFKAKYKYNHIRRIVFIVLTKIKNNGDVFLYREIIHLNRYTYRVCFENSISNKKSLIIDYQLTSIHVSKYHAIQKQNLNIMKVKYYF